MCACAPSAAASSSLRQLEGLVFPLVRSLFAHSPPPPLPSLFFLFERSLFLYCIEFFSSFVSHQELIAVTHTSTVLFMVSLPFWLFEEDKHLGIVVCASGTKATVVAEVFFAHTFDWFLDFLCWAAVFCLHCMTKVLSLERYTLFFYFYWHFRPKKGIVNFCFSGCSMSIFSLHLEPKIQSCFFSTSFCHSHRIHHDKKM